MKVAKESHLDHGVSEKQLQYLLQKFSDRKAFFIETVELPEELGMAPCGIYGPIMGDEPIPESAVLYEKRGDRPWLSRMIKLPARGVRYITVIAGPHKEEPCVVYTMYGGKPAPQEPDDPTCRDVEASKKFWAEHALVK